MNKKMKDKKKEGRKKGMERKARGKGERKQGNTTRKGNFKLIVNHGSLPFQ